MYNDTKRQAMFIKITGLKKKRVRVQYNRAENTPHDIVGVVGRVRRASFTLMVEELRIHIGFKKITDVTTEL